MNYLEAPSNQLFPDVFDAGSQKRVLIVDDARQISRTLTPRLRSYGYDSVVSNTRSAVAVAAENPPDLLLLDTAGATEEAFAMVRRIQEAVRRHVPIVLLTPGTLPELRQKAADFNVVGSFEKPCDLNQLLRVVTFVLSDLDSRAFEPILPN